MSWDVRIFGGAVEDSPAALGSRCADEGLALEWRPRDPARPDALNGVFVGRDGEPTHQIRVHEEEPQYLDELLRDYELPSDQADRLGSAAADYWIGIEAEYDDEWAARAAVFVAVVAAQTDGLIFDVGAESFLSAADWRRRHIGGRA